MVIVSLKVNLTWNNPVKAVNEGCKAVPPIIVLQLTAPPLRGSREKSRHGTIFGEIEKVQANGDFFFWSFWSKDVLINSA